MTLLPVFYDPFADGEFVIKSCSLNHQTVVVFDVRRSFYWMLHFSFPSHCPNSILTGDRITMNPPSPCWLFFGRLLSILLGQSLPPERRRSDIRMTGKPVGNWCASHPAHWPWTSEIQCKNKEHGMDEYTYPRKINGETNMSICVYDYDNLSYIIYL